MTSLFCAEKKKELVLVFEVLGNTTLAILHILHLKVKSCKQQNLTKHSQKKVYN
jgi:hypothetical protein